MVIFMRECYLLMTKIILLILLCYEIQKMRTRYCIIIQHADNIYYCYQFKEEGRKVYNIKINNTVFILCQHCFFDYVHYATKTKRS